MWIFVNKKNKEKNGRGKSFSDSEGKVLWPKVVAWVENLIILYYIIYIIRVQQNLGQCLVGI